jgi:hypothetical protein
MRKPLAAMFGAYVFEGNQIIKVRLQSRVIFFILFQCAIVASASVRAAIFATLIVVAVVILTSTAQSKRDATCLAEATFTGGHR